MFKNLQIVKSDNLSKKILLNLKNIALCVYKNLTDNKIK
jgi:hypothetical protein